MKPRRRTLKPLQSEKESGPRIKPAPRPRPADCANWPLTTLPSFPRVNTIAIDPSDSARIYVGVAANPSDAFALKIVE